MHSNDHIQPDTEPIPADQTAPPNDQHEEATAEQEAASDTDTSTDSSSPNPANTEQLSAQLADFKDRYLRLLAEFDTFKRRTARERIELTKSAAKDLIADLLPVLDDFERAFKAANPDPKGFELIYNKMKNLLEQQGLKAMTTEQQDFDPDLHEAIAEIPAPSPELSGKVLDAVEQGYYLHEKILRHAKVVVGK